MVNALKGYRNMAGFTQEDIANRLYIERTAYVHKENGRRRFTSEQEHMIYEMLKERLPKLKFKEVFPID